MRLQLLEDINGVYSLPRLSRKHKQQIADSLEGVRPQLQEDIYRGITGRDFRQRKQPTGRY